MSESVLYAFGVILALTGLYYISERIYKHFMCEKNARGIYTVIFHFDEDEELVDDEYEYEDDDEYEEDDETELVTE